MAATSRYGSVAPSGSPVSRTGGPDQTTVSSSATDYKAPSRAEVFLTSFGATQKIAP